MVGESFENCISEMARKCIKKCAKKCSPWFAFLNALKMFTMIGEHFEICISEMARNGLKTVHRGWRKFWKFYL